jgi:thioredoxin-dependent peroxiredoxin
VLGASFDEAANRAFAEKFNFPFKLLCDTDQAIGRDYGAVDPDDAGAARRITYLIGPDRRVLRVYATVKPAAHPAEVFADLP